MVIVHEPDWLTAEMLDDGIAKAKERLGKPPASLRLESYPEGLSAQIMYVGDPSAEGPTIARLHREFLPAHNLVPNGHHHQIYLTDPNHVAPEKQKAVLRQPVRKASATGRIFRGDFDGNCLIGVDGSATNKIDWIVAKG